MRLERSMLIPLVKTTAPHFGSFSWWLSWWGFYSPSSQSTSWSKLFVLALGKNALYRKSEFYDFVDFAVLNLARWTFLLYTCSVFEILAETSLKHSNSIFITQDRGRCLGSFFQVVQKSNKQKLNFLNFAICHDPHKDVHHNHDCHHDLGTRALVFAQSITRRPTSRRTWSLKWTPPWSVVALLWCWNSYCCCWLFPHHWTNDEKLLLLNGEIILDLVIEMDNHRQLSRDKILFYAVRGFCIYELNWIDGWYLVCVSSHLYWGYGFNIIELKLENPKPQLKLP